MADAGAGGAAAPGTVVGSGSPLLAVLPDAEPPQPEQRQRRRAAISAASTTSGFVEVDAAAHRTRGRPALPVTGIAVEVTERGDRPVAARVAEPTGGAHRRRSGVAGIGDGELGRGEDRLAGRRR